MDILNNELKIPIKYINKIDSKISVTVNKNWLLNYQKIGKNDFINHEKMSADEIAAQPSLEELGKNWTKIYVKVYKKKFINTIPLPRDKHSTSLKSQSDLTFPQLLRYVSETNYRNLWKESYKKYYSIWNSTSEQQKEQSLLTASTSDVAVMHEVLSRLYGCPLVYQEDDKIISVTPAVNPRSHCNLVPVILVIETSTSFILFHEQTAKYSLQECVMFSPSALSTGYSKPLFLFYQLLRLSRDLHDSGLALGEINLSDILLMDNYTLQVFPKLDDNIYLKSDDNKQYENNEIKNQDKLLKTSPISRQLYSIKIDDPPKPLDFGFNEKIDELCQQWIHGQLSNYDYLIALNNLAGRRFADPSCHHVMPWVTDFASRSGKNWRDLSKSKYRLNKGDRQLDLTFDTQQTSEVGHHVSDVLSEITYYVYLSRRYKRVVLCKHVRSHWVPGEYPVSIQRLQEWSPDECIPQFFTDPNVFKVRHYLNDFYF